MIGIIIHNHTKTMQKSYKNQTEIIHESYKTIQKSYTNHAKPYNNHIMIGMIISITIGVLQ